MDCKFVKDNLVELMNGNLPEKAELEVRSHLLLCDDCEAEFNSLKSINSALGMLPEMEPTNLIKDKVLARFHVEQSRSYSAKLKTISKEDSVVVYFSKWVFLQVCRPVVASIAAGILILLSFGWMFTEWRTDQTNVVAEYDRQGLPDRNEFDLDAKKRDSFLTKTARAEIDRELAELDGLDIPEQPWRLTDLDDPFAVSEVKSPGQEDRVFVPDDQGGKDDEKNLPDSSIASSGIEYTPESEAIASFYGSRFSSTKALSYYEGENIRELIDGGVKWLVSRQNSDGSFGPVGSRMFTTSLSGMCLLGEIGRFSEKDAIEALDKAFEFVRTQESKLKSGYYSGDDRDGERAHMAALCFLVEYYNLKGVAVHDNITRGLKYTFERMNMIKGWEFTESTFKADSSITGWYIILLESARRAGFRIDRMYIDRARAWVVKSTFGGDDEIAQTRNFMEDDSVKRSVAFMGRFFLKEKLEKKDISIIGARLLAFLCRESTYPEADINPYFLHFAALGLFQNHGKEWHIFNREVKKYLAEKAVIGQNSEGKHGGMYWSSAKRRYQKNGDEFYTALSLLTLQTYYRFNIIK